MSYNKRANSKSNKKKFDKKNNKPGKPNSGNPRRDDAEETSGTPEGREQVTSYANDPLYFFPADEKPQMESILQMSFPRIYGRQYDYGPTKLFGMTAARVRISPAIGPCESSQLAQAPINIAGSNTYARLSALNSKETKYAPQDVTLLILAMGSILRMAGYIRRILATTMVVNSKNTDVPRTYFTAMGVNYDEFKDQIPNYIDKFNTLVASIDSIIFPADIEYLRKATNMYTKCYKDSSTEYYGVYFPVPATEWKLNDTYNEEGGGLDTVEVVPINGTRNLSDYLDILTDLVNTMKTSATWAVIYSDLLNLYDKKGFNKIAIPFFERNESIEPEVNAYFNIMLRHATMVGANKGGAISNNDVCSDIDASGVKMNYCFQIHARSLDLPRLLNFYETTVPTPDALFEATRWMVVGKDSLPVQETGGTNWILYRDCFPQDSYVESLAMYAHNVAILTISDNIIDQTKTAAQLAAIVSNYSRMKDAPMIFGATYTDSGMNYGIIQSVYPLCDIDAFSTCDEVYLRNIINFGAIHFFGAYQIFRP